MPKSGREIEIKLRVADIRALRLRLRRLGAIAGPRLFEDNTLFDTPSSGLRRAGKLLRVRRERPATSAGGSKHVSSGTRGLLTFKSSVLGGLRTRRMHRYKENIEFELNFRPSDPVEKILSSLGFHPSFRYQKVRTAYRLPNMSGLHLDLDETPIGVYLELEGSRTSIDRAARRLGFTSRHYITATYGDLYTADCRKRGVHVGDFVFPPQKKSRSCALFT